MNRIKITRKQRMRRKFAIIGVASFLIINTVALLLFFNSTQTTVTKATGNESSDGFSVTLENSEIISEFTWESTPTKATLGPDAVRISSSAVISKAGRAGTRGITTGGDAKGISMVLASSPLYDADGIDISIDYKSIAEETGSLLMRGKTFDFGIRKGKLSIIFNVKSPNGKIQKNEVMTDYEIIYDRIFRTYRFIFSPTTGKAEIFANNVVIWTKEFEPGSKIAWNNEDIIVGKNLTGGNITEAVFDNLIIRVANEFTVRASASLSYFTLESDVSGIRIHWQSMVDENLESFVIERSDNGTDFENLAFIKTLNDTGEYAFEDNSITSGVYFYRLKQTFKDNRFIVHPASAVKIKQAKK